MDGGELGSARIGGLSGVMLSRPDRQVMGIGELGRRLIVIFVSLDIATLVTDVLVASATVSGDIGELAQAQESRVADVSALTAANAFRDGRWDPPTWASREDRGAGRRCW